MKFEKGHTMSAEMRAKISSKMKGIKKSPDIIAKMRLAQKGHYYTEERRLKQRAAMTGRKASQETKLKMRLAQTGSGGSNWKGGITAVVMQIRNSFKMRQWVSDIFHCDDFTCQACFARGGKLNAHHLKPFSVIYKENNIKTLDDALNCDELWDLNNGQTLCVECHKKINPRRNEY